MRLKSDWSNINSWELAKRTLAYFKQYKLLILVSLLSLGVVAATSGAAAFLVKPALDDIFINKDQRALLLIPILLVLIFALKGFFMFVQNYLMTYCGIQVLGQLRRELYYKMTDLPLRFFEDNRTGMLMARITSDVNLLSSSLPKLVELTRHLLTMLALLGVIFYRDPLLAVLSLVIYPLAIYPFIYFAKKLRKMGRKTQSKISDITTFLQETFSGIRVIKAFANEKGEQQNFARENEKLIKIAVKENKYDHASSPIMEFIGSIGIGLIVWYGGTQVIAGHSTPGTFFSFMTALIMLYQPIKGLSKTNIAIQKALSGAERVFEVLDSPELQVEQGGNTELKGPFQKLALKNVTFAYPDTGHPAVDNVNLEIHKGEKVAIVGPSGSGKTTLINLLPRFYEHQQGRIILNGLPTREYTLKSLRMFMGIVAQDNFLFNASIRDNIAYAMENVAEEEIIKAAGSAFAHDFIMELPQGYDTVIGERGVKLSGGQKQRITIARALLKNPSLLILDEATSALDTESERIVQMALDNLMLERTSIVIAHRLSTVLSSDRIVVMSRGRIISQGKHDQLLSSCSLYKKLYNMQFQENGDLHPASGDRAGKISKESI
ncbi:ABC transporter ATP-binding protein [Desulfonatronovibrio hydrogenovorans]|uniref:ABC transporter ATP-binding protein n=1 Tax=Desulfonatronovibrio hydrogenovorans TaxID=53245 RepID=UPI00048C0669|nr:ABC transporter transmembrane domain-containing protein [Desulfonatronovibrio hydrogenovorans]